MSEAREPYKFDGVTFEETLRKWTDSIPEELRHPADGTPRARILDAAAQHFAAEGFSNATTRAIAATAGVNQAMIHYYFHTKTTLYERVLAGMVVDLLSGLAGSLAMRAGSPADALAGLPERIVSVFTSDPVRVQILRREIGSGAPHLRAVVDLLGASGPRGFRTIMTGYVDAARAAGALPPEPPEAILSFLLVHAYGAILVEPMLRHVFGSEERKDNLETMMTLQRDLVRRALAAGPEEENAR